MTRREIEEWAESVVGNVGMRWCARFSEAPEEGHADGDVWFVHVLDTRERLTPFMSYEDASAVIDEIDRLQGEQGSADD